MGLGRAAHRLLRPLDRALAAAEREEGSAHGWRRREGRRARRDAGRSRTAACSPLVALAATSVDPGCRSAARSPRRRSARSPPRRRTPGPPRSAASPSRPPRSILTWRPRAAGHLGRREPARDARHGRGRGVRRRGRAGAGDRRAGHRGDRRRRSPARSPTRSSAPRCRTGAGATHARRVRSGRCTTAAPRRATRAGSPWWTTISST